MEQIVTGCSDCSFEYNCSDGWSNSECRHPKGDFRELTYLKDGATYEYKDGESPDWCPLNSEPITLIKK